ncbi:MAG: hypothetical protein KDA93_01720 [Planctomycetaceae bacterium]|nr:hypothetical protein [Planctomycetaceae bacterium]
MGRWGTEPWANDPAADWLDELFDATRLVEQVDDALALDLHDDIEEIRIAAHLLCTLGEAGLWPHEHLRRQVWVATSRLEAALSFRVDTNASLIASIREQVEKLQSLLG